MDGPRDHHIKWSNSDKDKDHISFMWGMLKKKDTDEFIYKREFQTHKLREQTYGYYGGKVSGDS